MITWTRNAGQNFVQGHRNGANEKCITKLYEYQQDNNSVGAAGEVFALVSVLFIAAQQTRWAGVG